jgi:hypothetical protein
VACITPPRHCSAPPVAHCGLLCPNCPSAPHLSSCISVRCGVAGAVTVEQVETGDQIAGSTSVKATFHVVRVVLLVLVVSLLLLLLLLLVVVVVVVMVLLFKDSQDKRVRQAHTCKWMPARGGEGGEDMGAMTANSFSMLLLHR